MNGVKKDSPACPTLYIARHSVEMAAATLWNRELQEQRERVWSLNTADGTSYLLNVAPKLITWGKEVALGTWKICTLYCNRIRCIGLPTFPPKCTPGEAATPWRASDHLRSNRHTGMHWYYHWYYHYDYMYYRVMHCCLPPASGPLRLNKKQRVKGTVWTTDSRTCKYKGLLEQTTSTCTLYADNWVCWELK